MAASDPPSPVVPLPYTVRRSARARRVTLRVAPGVGLVVSVPKRFARRDIPGVVEVHRAWAEAALAELERTTPEVCRVWPPEALELAALGRRVEIRWATLDRGRESAVAPVEPDPSRALGSSTSSSPSFVAPLSMPLQLPLELPPPAATIERSGTLARAESPAAPCATRAARWLDASTLELDVTPDDRAAVATAIARVLRAEGRRTLVPRLETLADRHALRFARASVRGQRSVWGSFSSSGTLSLNWKLLFLPPELVDYVLLHELAHTRHLDHSAAFWRLLDSLVPGARTLDRELAGAARRVPPWLELARGG